jgi:hypothetical protein
MNWIKVRTHLATHPHVVRIASALCLPSVHVLGALVHLWSVADSHADGDLLRNMTPAALDRMTETPNLTQELSQVGWIVGTPEGLQLVNYLAHNGASAKRRASESKRKNDVRKMSASCPHPSGTSAGLEKEKEKNNKKHKEKAPADTSEIVLTFPTDGKTNEFHLRQQQVDAWAQVYTGLDVFFECQKAMTWVLANPERRKTATGMPSFLVNWLSNATNRPKPTKAPTFFDRAPERKLKPLASEMMSPDLAAEIYGEIKPGQGVQRLEVRHG